MQKRVTIITGATRGIGKVIALRLAKEGFNLALVARGEEKLQEVKSAAEASGAKVLIIPVDLIKENGPEIILNKCLDFFGRLDILINNAGIAMNKPIMESTPEEWNKTFHINTRAPYFLCKQAIPYLQKSERPVIINMGSVVDHKGYINQSMYSSSKHALAGFTSVLAKEAQELGIRVHLISPGGVATEMVSEMRPDIDASSLIQPEEIAEMVVMLCNYQGKGTIDRIQIRRFDSLAFD